MLSCHAAPSSSGVTNTGDSAERGLDCRKPKPLASSPGIRLRSEDYGIDLEAEIVVITEDGYTSLTDYPYSPYGARS